MQKQRNSVVVYAFARGLSAAFAELLLFPFKERTRFRCACNRYRRSLYRIVFDEIINFRTQHIMDYYRGVSVHSLQLFLYQGIFGLFYLLFKKKKRFKSIEIILRGIIAATLTKVLVTPIEIIHAYNRTAATTHDARFVNIISKILKNHGVFGFWRGLKGSIILAVVPAIGQYLYEGIKQLLHQTIGYKSFLIDFIAGSLSKIICMNCLFPLLWLTYVIDTKQIVTKIYNLNCCYKANEILIFGYIKIIAHEMRASMNIEYGISDMILRYYHDHNYMIGRYRVVSCRHHTIQTRDNHMNLPVSSFQPSKELIIQRSLREAFMFSITAKLANL
eukprot:46875_1